MSAIYFSLLSIPLFSESLYIFFFRINDGVIYARKVREREPQLWRMPVQPTLRVCACRHYPRDGLVQLCMKKMRLKEKLPLVLKEKLSASSSGWNLFIAASFPLSFVNWLACFLMLAILLAISSILKPISAQIR